MSRNKRPFRGNDGAGPKQPANQNEPGELPRRVYSSSPEPRAPFRPYPRLWEWFADDPAIIGLLDRGMAFEAVTAFSKAMAMGAPKDTIRRSIIEQAAIEDERLERQKRGLAAKWQKGPVPHWLLHPDLDAPWRKQTPVSSELKASMEQRIKDIDKARREK